MQDLRIVNLTEGINTTLGQNDIEFIDLVEPSITVELKTRQVVGRHGTNKMGTQVGDSSLELIVRFKGDDVLDYFRKEQMLKKLLSTESYISISPMYSYSDLYKFEKIGDSPSNVQQMYSLYTWDVVLDGDWSIDRSGLLGNATIPLTTTGVPYRYTTEMIVDLANPIKKEGKKYTYEFINDGTFTQDSKRFPMEFKVTGMSADSINLITDGANYYIKESIHPRETLIYNGYSTKIDGRNVTDKTNFGSIVIHEGVNVIEVETTGVNLLGDLKGHLKFKQYVR